MTKQQINKVFSDFNKLKAVVIGDVMLDTYIWGKVNRISPEAPVPVVVSERTEFRLGGAANVAINIKSLGAKAILCGCVGNDEAGKNFHAVLDEQKLSNKGIITLPSRKTTQKTRVISQNHQMLRIDDETEKQLSNTETQKVIDHIISIIKKEKADVIIFEDYDKGFITPELIHEIVVFAKKESIPVAVDPKKKNFLSYKDVDLFKPNLKEFKEGTHQDFDHHNIAELDKAAAVFCAQQGIASFMVTLSERGIYIYNKKEKLLLPAHVRNIADVSGAGDTVISVAALCKALNLPDTFMASLANLAGGLVCETPGVVPVDKKRLQKEALEL